MEDEGRRDSMNSAQVVIVRDHDSTIALPCEVD